MELQELYDILKAETKSGSLKLDGRIAEAVFLRFALTLQNGELNIVNPELFLLPGSVKIQGECSLNGWLGGRLFRVSIVCSKVEEDFETEMSFRSDYRGTLGRFFREVSPCLRKDERGSREASSIIADIPISKPQITFITSDYNLRLPFTFQAETQMRNLKGWEPYGFLLTGSKVISGRTNYEEEFQLCVPVEGMISGFFRRRICSFCFLTELSMRKVFFILIFPRRDWRLSFNWINFRKPYLRFLCLHSQIVGISICISARAWESAICCHF